MQSFVWGLVIARDFPLLWQAQVILVEISVVDQSGVVFQVVW